MIDEMTLVESYLIGSKLWLFERVTLADTDESFLVIESGRGRVEPFTCSALQFILPSMPLLSINVFTVHFQPFNRSCSPSLRCYAPF